MFWDRREKRSNNKIYKVEPRKPAVLTAGMIGAQIPFAQTRAKGDGDSFRIPQVRPTDWDEANGRVRIPKAGFVRFRKSRPIQG